jgi:hypothetical protein
MHRAGDPRYYRGRRRIRRTLRAEDLARAVYQPETPGRRPTQSEHVAALRAMHSFARKYPNKFVLTGGKGRGPLWLERQR